MSEERDRSAEKRKYLTLLGERFSSREELITEIARLSARLSLPRGTEHFMSDIHGEFEAFTHIMNNCSGVIREKVQLWLGDQLTGSEVDALCTLIYYPETILRHRREEGTLESGWIHRQTEYMVYLARMLSSKYTRKTVRSRMPSEWAFLLDELMHYQNEESETAAEQNDNRRRYHESILNALIESDGSDGFMIALAQLIKNLAVDRLHVVGDIYDRGPRADSVMDILMKQHDVDIQWGNHDILWMGAAAGSEVCIAGAVRNCLAYHNTDILERGYGIPLRLLSDYASRVYPDMPLDQAMLHTVTLLMFKLEGQVVRRNPDFGMEDRLLLHRIDREKGKITIEGETWAVRPLPLTEVNPADPYALTEEEEALVKRFRHTFTHSQRLQEHARFLYRRGSMYLSCNDNLLFHGCVPLRADGSFLQKRMDGETLEGKRLMDYADQMARRAFFSRDWKALDFMWYLWGGADSPVCGRQLKTFARYFIADEAAWQEPRNDYYVCYNDEEVCRRILAAFGLTGENSRIINGHTPIRVIRGESPLKAGGRLIVIDGGFCRAYQKTTGIAGYTLIANSHGMRLMSHQPFTTLKDARETGRDIHSQPFEFATYPSRVYIRDTDYGRQLQERVADLTELLQAIRRGEISLGK